MRGKIFPFFAMAVGLLCLNALADTSVGASIWSEESSTGMSLFLGGDPASDKISQGMKEGADGKLKPADWPTLLRSKPPIFVLTSDGLKKTAITGVEVTAVGSLQINTELLAKEQSKRDLRNPPRRGLAQIGKAFAMGAKLRDLVDKNSLPATMASIPQKLHIYVVDRLKKQKAALDKFQVKPEDYSFAPFSSSRGKVWLAWCSRMRHVERVSQNVDKELVFAAILDARGSVLETLRGPKMVSMNGEESESWNPVFVVDFTGRGNEEIFAEVPYFEGNRVFRYSLKPGKGVNETTVLYDGS